jgi:DNA-binding transcriptional LysR family regulator
MNFQHLQTFCAVLTEKSMTAAAQKLYLTQPAVSQQIKQLEEEMGAELLVRGVRQVKPTSEGQLLYEYSQRILSLVAQAKVAIQTVGAEVSGTLRVGTLNSIGLYLIGPVFNLFLKNNGNVRLQLRYGEGDDVIRLLRQGEIDAAILPDANREFGYAGEDLDRESVSADEMWLVVSSKDKDVPSEISIKQLAAKPILLLSQEYPGFDSALAHQVKTHGIKMKPIFETSNVGTLKRALESGLGWGFVPAHAVRKQVQASRLTRVRINDFNYQTEMFCYFPKSHKKARTTEVFLEAVRQLASS